MSGDKDKEKRSALRVMPGVSIERDPRVKIKPRKRRDLTAEQYAEGVLSGNRTVIGRTFSLMESIHEGHREKATQVLEKIFPKTGKSIRLGISGVPGVGKSTFIESFGMALVEKGHRVAVLAIDPSSEVTGGSILGDKTRMEKLSAHPDALVRPSACGGWHGGVARSTRESILVCEAAGFDVVIVETVGVGQGETQVASMVDFFLLLMLSGAGDELQGIKRGIIEMADAIAINKADGDNIPNTRKAKIQFESALHLLIPPTSPWQPKVLTCSAKTGTGLDDIWKMITQHREWAEGNGMLQEKRREQSLYWLEQTIEGMLKEKFYKHPKVDKSLEETRRKVYEDELSPFAAAESLINLAFPGEGPSAEQ